MSRIKEISDVGLKLVGYREIDDGGLNPQNTIFCFIFLILSGLRDPITQYPIRETQ